MLIGQWSNFFLILPVKKNYWLTNATSGSLGTAYGIKKLFFSVTMASRFEIVDEEYIKEEKDKSEMKTWRKGQSTGGTFWRSGRMKETSKQI